MEPGDGKARHRMDRALGIGLRAGLLAVAAMVAYLWALRAGSDLSWDEAFNLRVYSRHPATAIALYDEHNNHPLESLIKSLFVVVIGDQPAMRRLSGLLFVAAHLALAWALFRRLARGGAVASATLLALMMLLARGISHQAMELRGYFLSSVLELGWFWLLARETDLLRKPDAADPPKSPRWTWRVAMRYGLVAGLIAFTLPSNVLVLPAFWVLTVAAFHENGAGLAVAARRGFQLAAASAALSALFYAPIAAAQLLGFSTFHNSEARPVSDRAAAMLNEMALAARQLAPRGAPVEVFGWVLVAIAAAAAMTAFRPRGRLARTALIVAAAALIARIAFGAFVAYPERTRTAQVAPLLIALVLATHALTASWTLRAQTIAGLALVALAFGALRELRAEAGVYRVPTEVSDFLEAACRPETRNVLIVTENLKDPLEPVTRTFGPARVVSGQRELDARLRGEQIAGRLAEGSWKKKLREWIAPDVPLVPIDAAKVEVLVLIDDVTRSSGATQWKHAALDTIEARLPRRSEFRRDEFRIVIFEGPAGR